MREASGEAALPPSLPLASREASPLTGLWQPSGIDQQRSLVATCGIRVDKYMLRYRYIGSLLSHPQLRIITCEKQGINCLFKVPRLTIRRRNKGLDTIYYALISNWFIY